MSEIKLKPCPFCGGEAELYSMKRDKRKVLGIYYKVATIKCKRCPAKIEVAGQDNDRAFKNAAKLWNRRAGEQDEVKRK